MGTGVANFSFPTDGAAPQTVAVDDDMDGLYDDEPTQPAAAPQPAAPQPSNPSMNTEDDIDDIYD